MDKELIIERLRGALRGAVTEVRRDPDFTGKVVNTICSELGIDSMASLYIASKVKNLVKEKKDVS